MAYVKKVQCTLAGTFIKGTTEKSKVNIYPMYIYHGMDHITEEGGYNPCGRNVLLIMLFRRILEGSREVKIIKMETVVVN